MKKKLTALLLAAVMLLSLCACSDNEAAPASAEFELVIIAGRHANGMLPTLEMLQDSGLPELIQNSVTYYQDNAGLYHADARITVIVNDGNPEPRAIQYNGTPVKLRMEDSAYDLLEEDVAALSTTVLHALLDDSLVADDEEADLIGSVLKAATILEASSATNKAIMILDNGISTSGKLNMSSFDIQAATPDVLMNNLAPGSFPDLSGVSVWFYGLGNVDEENQTTVDDDTIVMDQLCAFWTTYFEACGATLPADLVITTNLGGTPMQNFDKPKNGNRDAAGNLWYPSVANVSFTKTETTIIEAEKLPDGEPPVFTANKLNFVGGKATFKDGEAAAIKELTNEKDYFQQILAVEPDTIFYVVGSIAKDDPALVKETGTLSWERAAAVARIMIEHCDVPAKNIRLIGAGLTPFSWRNAEEFPGGQASEANMARNRVVAIIPSAYPKYMAELENNSESDVNLVSIACEYGKHPTSN